jgi:AraC family transcriptional regulator
MTAFLTQGQYSGQINRSVTANGLITTITTYSDQNFNPEYHYHENAVISFMLHGGNIENRQHENFERTPGDIAYFAPGEWHRTLPGAALSKNLNLEIPEHFIKSHELHPGQLTHQKLNMLHIYNDMLSADACSNTSMLMSVLHLMAKPDERQSIPGWVNRLKTLLQDDWITDFKLAELASLVDVHPVTLSRNFSRYFGTSFGEYRRQLRIERSLPMVRNGKVPLTQIAFSCGFADQSHFTRNFRRFTGFLPKDFRRL